MLLKQSNVVVLVVLFVVIGGAVIGGIGLGRHFRHRPDSDREPVGAVQGALLALVGLLLAFGLTMAVGRYEARRGEMVHEANAIGTTYLRAQLLAEPARSASIELLVAYADAAIVMAETVPDSSRHGDAVATISSLQRELWALAGDAVADEPQGTAPRLYVETLNDTIDAHALRLASLRDRVPTSVQLLQVLGSALALGVFATYVSMFGRHVLASLLAAAFVVLILFVSFDLDRPRRGFITVPATALTDLRASMEAGPAAEGP